MACCWRWWRRRAAGGSGEPARPGAAATLLELRATRVAAAFLAGAALAVGGVVAQGLFRNPLVSPSILGTTGRGDAGRASWRCWPSPPFPPCATCPTSGPTMVMPLGCLLGAELALLLLLAFVPPAQRQPDLLLTGFILSSLFLSLGGFVTSLAQDSWDLARAVVSFTLGGVGGAAARQLWLAAPLVAGRHRGGLGLGAQPGSAALGRGGGGRAGGGRGADPPLADRLDGGADRGGGVGGGQRDLRRAWSCRTRCGRSWACSTAG